MPILPFCLFLFRFLPLPLPLFRFLPLLPLLAFPPPSSSYSYLFFLCPTFSLLSPPLPTPRPNYPPFSYLPLPLCASPEMTCDACQLNDARVCEFVNRFRDASPLDPFELRLFGPRQLSPCILAAVKRRLVDLPLPPPTVAAAAAAPARVGRTIGRPEGVVILNKSMIIDDFKKTVVSTWT